MYCRACGHTIADNARFCANCGQDQFAHAQQREEMIPIRTHSREIELTQLAGMARAEARRRKVTLIVCAFFGIQIALGWFSWNTSIMDGAGETINTGFYAFISFMFGTIPFGLAGIYSVIKEHGFLFFGTWVLLIALFALVLIVAVFAGIPYALHLIREARSFDNAAAAYERELEQLRGPFVAA